MVRYQEGPGRETFRRTKVGDGVTDGEVSMRKGDSSLTIKYGRQYRSYNTGSIQFKEHVTGYDIRKVLQSWGNLCREYVRGSRDKIRVLSNTLIYNVRVSDYTIVKIHSTLSPEDLGFLTEVVLLTG